MIILQSRAGREIQSLESWDNPHYAKLLGGGISLCVLVLTLALGYVVKFK